jgi:predicted permease
MNRQPQPPGRVVAWLAHVLLAGDDAAFVRQDLAELYARDRQRGATAATAYRRYLRHLIASAFSLWRTRLPLLPRPRASDVTHAMRTLGRSPWFATACIGTVALSIALAATVFAVVDGVLFKPLPYPEPGRLVLVFRSIEDPARRAQMRDGTGRAGSQFSAADLEAWRHADPRLSISAFVVNFGIGPVANAGVTEETTWAARIDRTFFDVLGRGPLAGGFSEEDYRRPFETGRLSAHPALISHRLWRRLHPDGGLPRGVLRVGDGTLQVVGVLPPDFVFPAAFARTAPDVLLPLHITPEERGLQGVARLPPDLTAAAAGERWHGAVLEPAEAALGLRERPVFWRLMAAVVAIVLLAALNVATLLAARGCDRAGELAVRSALGASTGRLLQLMLAEALIITTAGGALGLLAARPLLNLASTMLPAAYLLIKPPTIDLRVIVFAMVTATATVMAFAAWPAVRVARSSVCSGLRETRATHRQAGRRLALVAQSAIGIVVVLAGTLLVGSFTTLWQEGVGFDRNGTALVEVTARGVPDPLQRAALLDEAVRVASRVPGIERVSSLTGPFLRNAIAGSIFTAPPGSLDVIAQDVPITGGFFETAGIRLLSGRLPGSDEIDMARPLAVVSDSLARAFWPGREPLGQLLSAPNLAVPVVGVVADIRVAGLEERQPAAEIYVPLRLVGPRSDRVLLVRSARDGSQIAGRVAAAILRERPELMVTRAESIDSALGGTVRTRRFQSGLFGAFAAAALVLLGVGMFGAIAMNTASRGREFGVRMALGATGPTVRGMVLAENLAPVVAGLLLGGAAAWWMTDLIAGLIYGVGPHDPRLWATAAAFVMAIALLATWLPAVRASRVDPNVVLRSQ